MNILTPAYHPVGAPFTLYGLARASLTRDQLDALINQEWTISPLGASETLRGGRIASAACGLFLLSWPVMARLAVFPGLLAIMGVVFVLGAGLLLVGRVETRARLLASAHLRNLSRSKVSSLMDSPAFHGQYSTHRLMEDIADRNARRRDDEWNAAQHQAQSPPPRLGGCQEI